VAAWPASAEELVQSQEELGQARPALWRPAHLSAVSVAGCFVCFPRGISGAGSRGDRAWAGAALVRERVTAATAVAVGEAGAPYEPGLLALREGPVLEAAVRSLPDAPEVLMVNATGRDHPRRAGLALHLGSVLDVPTVGVTHRPLFAVDEWPADEPGATSGLVLDDEVVGCWLRTRRSARPLCVNPGWRTDLETAVQIVLATTGKSRTPEPLRAARRVARVARAGQGD
jgi:deoxyribonuclease V